MLAANCIRAIKVSGVGGSILPRPARSQSCPRSRCRARGDNRRHDPLRHRRRRDASPHVRGRAARRPPGGRAAPQPAGLDSRQLPGARIRAPSVRRFRAEQGGAALPLRQLDKATWLARCAADAPLVVRYRVYAFDTSVRAAFLDAGARLLQRHRASACASRVAKPSRTRSRSPACPTAGRSRRASSRDAGAGAHEFVAADYDELVDHPVELGRFWRARFDAAGVRARVRRRRRPARLRRRAPARRHAAHLRGRDPLLARRAASAPFDRYLFLLNALEDGRGGLEHRASTALVAARRDLPRQAAFDLAGPARERQERAERRLRRPPRPDRARVLPRLERQAAEAARLRELRLRARELHRAALVLRGLHVVLRRPAAAAQRPDRRAALPEAAREDDQRRAGVAGPRRAERRRGELRRLGQVLPRRREHAERDDQLLRQGLAGRARVRPDACAATGKRLARRRHAAALAQERGRADRRGRHRRCARGGRRPLVRARARRLGARHRRAAACRAAAALRGRRRARSRRRSRSGSACASTRAR